MLLLSALAVLLATSTLAAPAPANSCFPPTTTPVPPPPTDTSEHIIYHGSTWNYAMGTVEGGMEGSIIAM